MAQGLDLLAGEAGKAIKSAYQKRRELSFMKLGMMREKQAQQNRERMANEKMIFDAKENAKAIQKRRELAEYKAGQAKELKGIESKSRVIYEYPNGRSGGKGDSGSDGMPIEQRQALMTELKETNLLLDKESDPFKLDVLAKRRNTIFKSLGFSDERIQALSVQGAGKLKVFENVANMMGTGVGEVIGKNKKPGKKTGGKLMIDADGVKAMVYPDGSFEEIK